MHWPPCRIAPLESGFPSEEPPPYSAQRLIMPPSDDQLDFHPATLRQPPEPISDGAKNRLYAVPHVATSGIADKRGDGSMPSSRGHLLIGERLARRLEGLAWVTIVGTVYFVLAVTALHFLRPDYNPTTRLLSDYAVGPYGYLMTSAWFALGLVSFALAFGIRDRRKSLNDHGRASPCGRFDLVHRVLRCHLCQFMGFPNGPGMEVELPRVPGAWIRGRHHPRTPPRVRQRGMAGNQPAGRHSRRLALAVVHWQPAAVRGSREGPDGNERAFRCVEFNCERGPFTQRTCESLESKPHDRMCCDSSLATVTIGVPTVTRRTINQAASNTSIRSTGLTPGSKIAPLESPTREKRVLLVPKVLFLRAQAQREAERQFPLYRR